MLIVFKGPSVFLVLRFKGVGFRKKTGGLSGLTNGDISFASFVYPDERWGRGSLKRDTLERRKYLLGEANQKNIHWDLVAARSLDR